MYKLSTSLENYLEALYQGCDNSGHVKSVDIAEKLHVSKASVNRAMNVLAEKGYVIHHPYSAITLTSEGKELAQNIILRHTTLLTFLTDILGVKDDIAQEEACAMEHILSMETIMSIRELTRRTKHPE